MTFTTINSCTCCHVFTPKCARPQKFSARAYTHAHNHRPYNLNCGIEMQWWEGGGGRAAHSSATADCSRAQECGSNRTVAEQYKMPQGTEGQEGARAVEVLYFSECCGFC